MRPITELGSYDRIRASNRRSKRRARQMPESRCAVRGCETFSRFENPLLSGKRYCFKHYPLYVRHHAILERIRAIPNRDAI